EWRDNRWQKHSVARDGTATIEIDHLSAHWLGVVFRFDCLTPSPTYLQQKEVQAASAPGVAKERDSRGAAVTRRVLEHGNVWTREFFGVGQRASQSHAELCDELRAVLARRPHDG